MVKNIEDGIITAIPRKVSKLKRDKEIPVKAESFVNILSFMDWRHVFTNCVQLSRISRKMILANHGVVSPSEH